MSSTLNSPLYEVFDNVLTPEFCQKVIYRFDLDQRSQPGIVGAQGIKLDVKQSLDLRISDFEDWKEYDDVFFQTLLKYLPSFYSNDFFKDNGSHYDQGFQIQKTKTDQIGYTWHDDFHMEMCNGRLSYRYITYIFYMNDVQEGGETEFWEGTKIKPKTGRLLLFSSDWHHVHRGLPPISNTKYIVTGWTYRHL
jgi:hypothetical protein